MMNFLEELRELLQQRVSKLGETYTAYVVRDEPTHPLRVAFDWYDEHGQRYGAFVNYDPQNALEAFIKDRDECSDRIFDDFDCGAIDTFRKGV